MLRTKFKYWSVAALITSCCLAVILYASTIMLTNKLPVWGYLAATGVLLLITGLIVYELRNKVTLITVEEDMVKSTKFVGLGRQSSIRMSEINGYTTCSAPGEWDSSEVLFLVSGNKNVVRLSESYHKNYHELRNYFTKRFKNLGQAGYTLFS